MAVKKQSTIDRNNLIRERYSKLDAKDIYKQSYIFKILAKEFFLATATIENIIYHRI